MLNLVMDICNADFEFAGFVDVMDYFKRVINVLKQMNYSAFQSPEFNAYETDLKNILAEKTI